MTAKTDIDTIQAIVQAQCRAARVFMIREDFDFFFRHAASSKRTDIHNWTGIFRNTYFYATQDGISKREIIEIFVKVSQEYLTEFRHYTYRGHASPYWNPTAKPVNIESLGLKDDSGKNTLTKLLPGEILFVPYSYTVGKKKSTIYGVAPQLKPIPQSEIPENFLDLKYSSYLEWCIYGEPMVSTCCKAPGLWCDVRQKLVCKKCQAK